jgi:hypothetical protein
MSATSVSFSLDDHQALTRWDQKYQTCLNYASKITRLSPDAKPKKVSSVYHDYLKAYHDLKCDVHAEILIHQSSGRVEDPVFSQENLSWLAKLKQVHQCVKQIVCDKPISHSVFSIDAQIAICMKLWTDFKQQYRGISTSDCLALSLHDYMRQFQSLKKNLKMLHHSLEPSDPRSSRVTQLKINVKELHRRVPETFPRSLEAQLMEYLKRIQPELHKNQTKIRSSSSRAVLKPDPVFIPAARVSPMAPSLAENWKKTSLTPAERNAAELQLTQGIQITSLIIKKLLACMPRIIKREAGDGLTFYGSRIQHSVFSLDVAPQFVFKMLRDHIAKPLGVDDSMKARYDQMVYAKGVCMKHGLNHLVIPQAAMIKPSSKGREYEVLVEQKLDFNPHNSQQEEYFKTIGEQLRPAVEDLTHFICLTGYNDVEVRNNPVLDPHAPVPKIGLIDIEFMGDPTSGLYGGNLGEGLANIVGLKQIRSVQAVARAYKLNSKERYQRAIASRSHKNEEAELLKAFHAQRNINIGDEPLVVDHTNLDFSVHPLYPDKQLPAKTAERIQKLALKVICMINEEISKKSSEETVAERRCVLIETHSDELSASSTTPVGHELYQAYEAKWITDDQFYRATILGYAVQKLVDLGLVFKVKKHNAGGYLLQV